MIRRISTLLVYGLTGRNFTAETRLDRLVGEFRRHVSPEARFERYRRRCLTLPNPKSHPALKGLIPVRIAA